MTRKAPMTHIGTASVWQVMEHSKLWNIATMLHEDMEPADMNNDVAWIFSHNAKPGIHVSGCQIARATNLRIPALLSAAK